MKLEHMTEQEKRDRIINSLDQNMFVEAGAGAGKTTIMVSRILHQLMTGVRPREIVAITFTNAATRELKARILSRAIRESGRTGVYTETELNNLKTALDELDQMQISTIHSFCHRILTEKMFDAGLPFGFGLMEEADAAALRDKYFGLWAESLKRSDWEVLLKVCPYRSGVLDRLKNTVSELDRIHPDTRIEVALPDLSEDDARAALQPMLDHVLSEALDLVNEAYGEQYYQFTDVSEAYLTAYGKGLKTVVTEADFPGICAKLSTPATTKSFIVKSVTKATMEGLGITGKDDQSSFKQSITDGDQEIREYLITNGDAIGKIRAGYDNYRYRPYLKYAIEARNFIREKSYKGLLTNDLLLEKTGELVKASADIRKFFGNKFRIIYVDEFQDTDHLQESFIRLLASDPEDPNKLRDGALFVVGDPKQSIYRFRGAEPEVYYETKAYMEGLSNACVVELSDNYRSNQYIIDWVNDKFAPLEITKGQPYIPMHTGKPLPRAVCAAGTANAGVKSIGTANAGGPGTGLPEKLLAGFYQYESPETALAKDDIGNDMVAVCRLILSLIQNGYQIADIDLDDRLYYREIRFSDFLILSMNTPGMDAYVECMHEYGIPVVSDSKQDVSRNRYLLAVYRLYAYLVNPYDAAARAGALELLEVLGAQDAWRNEAVLQTLYEDTKAMSAYGCLQYLVSHPELYLSKDQEIEDYEISDLQVKLIQMSEAVTTGTQGNRRHVLDAMTDYMETVVEHELVPGRDVNAVRFMNLHKAKGLEGGIVIWTNRYENKEFKQGSYRCGNIFYPSVNYTSKGFTRAEWCAYGGDESLISRAMEEDACETIRLEYVAATRAKQAFIFMDRYGAKPGNLFSEGFDLTALKSVKEIVGQYREAGSATPVQVLPVEKKEQRTLDKADAQTLAAPVFLSESPSDYEDESAGKAGKTAAAVAGSAPGHQQGPEPDQAPGKPERPRGNIFGTVMHRAFELVIDRWNCEPAKMGITSDMLIPSCVKQAVNESIDDIPEGEVGQYESFLTEAVMAFGYWYSASDLKKDAEKIYTELPFSYLEEGKGQPGAGDSMAEGAGGLSAPAEPYAPVWMHGEADLVIRSRKGEYTIVDYKSDDDANYPTEEAFLERLRGKYAPQIAAYQKAVRRVFGLNPDAEIRMLIVSFSRKQVETGKTLRVRVTQL